MQSREHAEVRGVSFSDGGDITSGGWEEWLKGNKSTSASGNKYFMCCFVFCCLTPLHLMCLSVCVLLHMCLFKVYSIILAVLLSFICIGLHAWSFSSAVPGVQRQIVHCVERTTGIVEEHWCDPLTRPDDNQTSCQKDPCPAVWVFPRCQHRREQEELPIKFHLAVVTVLLYFFLRFCLNR